jgi:hypothetical protein
VLVGGFFFSLALTDRFYATPSFGLSSKQHTAFLIADVLQRELIKNAQGVMHSFFGLTPSLGHPWTSTSLFSKRSSLAPWTSRRATYPSWPLKRTFPEVLFSRAESLGTRLWKVGMCGGAGFVFRAKSSLARLAPQRWLWYAAALPSAV